MRFATTVEDGRPSAAVVGEGRLLRLAIPDAGLTSVRSIAASGGEGLERIRDWVGRQPDGAYQAIDDVELGPAVPDPGAIYAIGLNYAAPGDVDGVRPERPLVYAKLPTSVSGHGAALTWDRSLTANVDAEVELGVVIGEPASSVSAENALQHVFGFTCINDISSRDPWLDGDQWLLGKSMAGFCPVGPWVVTSDEIAPDGLRLRCSINGVTVQDDSTSRMRFSVAEVIAYISRHTTLRPGDLIATGTPARLVGPLGPERHLEAGDVATVSIEQIGQLTTRIT